MAPEFALAGSDWAPVRPEESDWPGLVTCSNLRVGINSHEQHELRTQLQGVRLERPLLEERELAAPQDKASVRQRQSCCYYPAPKNENIEVQRD